MKINQRNCPAMLPSSWTGTVPGQRGGDFPETGGTGRGACFKRHHAPCRQTRIGISDRVCFQHRELEAPARGSRVPHESAEGIFSEHEEDIVLENIRLRWIGSRERLSEEVIQEIARLEEKTKDNQGLVFTLAFNYGGRDEIVHAANELLKQAKKSMSKNSIISYIPISCPTLIY